MSIQPVSCLPKILPGLLVFYFALTIGKASAQSDSIVLRDIAWDKSSPAGMTELFIPSAEATLAGFIYRANGQGKHPTLILLHGYPGNERNLDIAQVVRNHGWNVLYVDYRGSWGSQGQFTFKHCVEDVVQVVAFCQKYQDSLGIDTAHLALFGHSMGGWVCLKAIQQLPGLRKAFVLSAWDISKHYRAVLSAQESQALDNHPDTSSKYFVLQASLRDLFVPVMQHPDQYDLARDSRGLADKQIVMIDENVRNKGLADALKTGHHAYFRYEVWPTDHPFTNKRVALMHAVIAFLDQ